MEGRIIGLADPDEDGVWCVKIGHGPIQKETEEPEHVSVVYMDEAEAKELKVGQTVEIDVEASEAEEDEESETEEKPEMEGKKALRAAMEEEED